MRGHSLHCEEGWESQAEMGGLTLKKFIELTENTNKKRQKMTIFYHFSLIMHKIDLKIQFFVLFCFNKIDHLL